MKLKHNKKQILIYVFSIVVIICVTSFIVINIKGNTQTNKNDNINSSASDWVGNKQTYNGQKSNDSISIPGFDFINLKAGETHQATNFYNPPNNNCFFRLSLILDKQTLWKSDLFAPGKAIYSIDICKKLKEGEYKNAKLKYECFSLDNSKKALNGSEITLCLKVLK